MVEFFGPEAVSTELMFAFFLAALGYVGLKVLRLPDKEWERGGAPGAEPARVA